jgi:hypothetical protein
MCSWMIGLVRATCIGVALLSMGGNPYPAAAQEDERLEVVRGFFDAASRGDADVAMAAFADSAVFIGARPTGPCSPQTPCTDLAGIREQQEGAIANHICYTIRSVEVAGAIVLGQIEIRDDPRRAIGVERLLRSFIMQVPNDQISFYAALDDLADPQTAFAAAVTAGTQAPGTPLPNPATPCAGQ